MNLAVNASHATLEGGNLVIETKAVNFEGLSLHFGSVHARDGSETEPSGIIENGSQSQKLVSFWQVDSIRMVRLKTHWIQGPGALSGSYFKRLNSLRRFGRSLINPNRVKSSRISWIQGHGLFKAHSEWFLMMTPGASVWLAESRLW